MNPLHKSILEEWDEKYVPMIRAFGQMPHESSTEQAIKSFLLSSLRRQAEQIIEEIPDDTEMKKEGFISLIPGNTNVLKESLRSKYLGKEKV